MPRNQVDRHNSYCPGSPLTLYKNCAAAPDPFDGYVKSGVAADGSGFHIFTLWASFSLRGRCDSHVSEHLEFDGIERKVIQHMPHQKFGISISDKAEFTDNKLDYEDVENSRYCISEDDRRTRARKW